MDEGLRRHIVLRAELLPAADANGANNQLQAPLHRNELRGFQVRMNNAGSVQGQYALEHLFPGVPRPDGVEVGCFFGPSVEDLSEVAVGDIHEHTQDPILFVDLEVVHSHHTVLGLYPVQPLNLAHEAKEGSCVKVLEGDQLYRKELVVFCHDTHDASSASTADAIQQLEMSAVDGNQAPLFFLHCAVIVAGLIDHTGGGSSVLDLSPVRYLCCVGDTNFLGAPGTAMKFGF